MAETRNMNDVVRSGFGILGVRVAARLPSESSFKLDG